MITDLSYNESIFIEIQRIFHQFFRSNLYFLRQYSYNDRDGDSLTYENDKIKRQIFFEWGFGFEISIIKKSIFSSSTKLNENNVIRLTKIKNNFREYIKLSDELQQGESFEILNNYYNFIKNELMPIIKGEMWIDELLKMNLNK
jgi:hypothetical protein